MYHHLRRIVIVIVAILKPEDSMQYRRIMGTHCTTNPNPRSERILL